MAEPSNTVPLAQPSDDRPGVELATAEDLRALVARVDSLEKENKTLRASLSEPLDLWAKYGVKVRKLLSANSLLLRG